VPATARIQVGERTRKGRCIRSETHQHAPAFLWVLVLNRNHDAGCQPRKSIAHAFAIIRLILASCTADIRLENKLVLNHQIFSLKIGSTNRYYAGLLVCQIPSFASVPGTSAGSSQQMATSDLLEWSTQIILRGKHDLANCSTGLRAAFLHCRNIEHVSEHNFTQQN
jgi:hypothetical protein